MAERSSFAFTPAQPVQTNTSLSPGFRGGEVVGGDSEGGVVRASPMTAPTGDTGIPEFFARMVEPYVRQKQAEAVVKGATDVIAGRSIKDIAKGDSGIASIFGPSGYHQGAAAFAATSAWAKTKTDILADPELEKLNPDQLGTYLAGKYQGMMTGDPVTDGLLSHTMLQDHAPLVAHLSTQHEAYVQRQALAGWSNTLDASATGLQQLLSSQTDTDGPTQSQARSQAVGNYLSGIQKPYGMKDEVWQSGLANHARAALTGGNFYAFEALRAKGLYSALTDDQQAKLDTAYQAAASRALGMVSADPEINRRLATLDMQIRVGGFKSPSELVAPVAEINRIAAQRTGIAGRDLISGDDLLAMQKQMNEGQFAAGLRLQEHQFQLDKQERDHAWDLEKDRLKAEEALRLARTAAGAGNVSPSLATGTVKEADVNAVFGEAVAGGNFGLLAHNFRNGHYVNSFAAQQLQSPVANSLGVGLTEGFKGAYRQWSGLNQANPAAAVAYYGDQAGNMAGYDRLVRSGDTELSAYAQTFGRGPELGKADLPPGVKFKDAQQSVSDAVRADDSRWLGLVGSRTPLATSSAQMLTAWLMPKAAGYSTSSGVALDKAASHQLQAAYANGEIERAGPFVWNNQHPTQKLGSFLGLPDDAMDKLVTKVAGEKLVKAGFSEGAGAADYTVLRFQQPNGQPALYVVGHKADGHTDVVLTLDDLRAGNRKLIAYEQDGGSAGEAARRHSLLPNGAFSAIGNWAVSGTMAAPSIDISGKGTAARRDTYRHAMDPKGPAIEITAPVTKAAKAVVDADKRAANKLIKTYRPKDPLWK